VFKVNSHCGNLGSIPAEIFMSRGWSQVGHPSKVRKSLECVGEGMMLRGIILLLLRLFTLSVHNLTGYRVHIGECYYVLPCGYLIITIPLSVLSVLSLMFPCWFA